MNTMSHDEFFHQVQMITDQDLKRVLSCLENAHIDEEIIELWDEKLERSQIISQRQAPANLVTIHSTMQCQEMGHLSLVFPHEADIDTGKISILAPLGISLLGARTGQLITWRCRNGRSKKLMIDTITYQPESAGHWHL
ncbi:MAG: GreA/GreB family elongation factor [Oligoflexus sp.]